MIKMIAMTINNSISEKPNERRRLVRDCSMTLIMTRNDGSACSRLGGLARTSSKFWATSVGRLGRPVLVDDHVRCVAVPGEGVPILLATGENPGKPTELGPALGLRQPIFKSI